MKFILESANPKDYLSEIPPIIQFHTPLIKNKVEFIESKAKTPKEKVKLAFEISLYEIKHSFDIDSKFVSISGEDALQSGEGICFAKAHLFATLVRAMGVPCGFCYQRVLRKGTIESGYALHGLNAVFLKDSGWFRLDPRGNKSGIDSQFSIETEKLAYPIREELGEFDYPNIFLQPLPSVIHAMENFKDRKELFLKRPGVI